MTLKELLEKRAALATKMQVMHKAASDEDRGFTGDERTQWDQMRGDIESLDQQIKDAEEARGLEQYINAPVNDLPSTEIPQQPVNKGDTYEEVFNRHFIRGVAPITTEQRTILANGYNVFNNEETRAMSVGVPAEGGYTVPDGFGNRIIERMQDFGGILAVANIMQTETGNDIHWPTNDDVANVGSLLAENTAAPETDTTFGQVTLGAYFYTSRLIKVPYTLMQDSAFDMEAFLTRLLGTRLGRGTAPHLTTGTGVGQPTGFMTGASSGGVAATLAGLTYADLLDLEHSVDPAYRRGANVRYVFNDQTLRVLKGLLDGQGRPLWVPSIAVSAPATINGYGYTIDQGVANIGTSARSIAFGDFSEFTVRVARGITLARLNERFADSFQVGFVGFMRLDSLVMDSHAIKYLEHPAT